jgi:hypothetical protein
VTYKFWGDIRNEVLLVIIFNYSSKTINQSFLQKTIKQVIKNDYAEKRRLLR